MHLKDPTYNDRNQIPSSEAFRHLKKMGEQLKVMEDFIERREMEAKIAGYAENKLPPVLKHKRNFKDPSTMPKKTFLKDDEEYLEEMEGENEYGEENENGSQREASDADFERN
jgi:hypothetical protein